MIYVELNFTIVADKLDLSLNERRLEREKYNLGVSFINQVQMGLRGLNDINGLWNLCICRFLFIFSLSTFLCFVHVSERHLYSHLILLYNNEGRRRNMTDFP